MLVSVQVAPLAVRVVRGAADGAAVVVTATALGASVGGLLMANAGGSSVTPNRVAEAIAGQEAIFANHRRAYEGQLSILRQRVSQLNAEIRGMEGQVAGLQQQATLLSGDGS